MPKVSFQRVFQKTQCDLPDLHNLEIGKIVTRWAQIMSTMFKTLFGQLF